MAGDALRRLEEEWPDEDRRDDSLDRLAAMVKYGPVVQSRVVGLSDAEKRAVEAASHGLSPEETADIYTLSVWTIREQLKSARRRLAAKTTAHAVACALREGLIT